MATNISLGSCLIVITEKKDEARLKKVWEGNLLSIRFCIKPFRLLPGKLRVRRKKSLDNSFHQHDESSESLTNTSQVQNYNIQELNKSYTNLK